ncbi:hypothetical protein AJY52_00790, partial [Campylobacter lari]
MTEIKTKRLAIHLYGHMRTYEKTYQSFYQNIIEINEKDGWNIDIFIHTWDVFNRTDPNIWHAKDNLFPTITGKKLSSDDKINIIKIYQPKKYIIEVDPNKPAGRYESVRKAMNLRKEYEEEMNIAYDIYLTTRPDLLFLNPLRIDEYLDLYKTQQNLKNIGFPEKINFCSCWYFRYPRYLPILDPRFPNESDLLWFSNYCSNNGFDPLIAFQENSNIINVFIKYRFNMDFIQYREVTKNIDFFVFTTYLKNKAYMGQKDQIKTLNNILCVRKQVIDFQLSQIEQQDKIIKDKIITIKNINSQLIQIQKKNHELTFYSKYGTAKTRIKNQLSYKLGQAMIANSKTLFGYLTMPMILLSIMISHRNEKRIYCKKIKKDPSLKQPPLESYPDYQEALKLKNHLSYKLGQVLIQANKTWY